MTAVDTFAKLLQHGPLTRGEIITITGWSSARVDRTTEHLAKRLEIARVNLDGKSLWRLTSTARVPAIEQSAFPRIREYARGNPSQPAIGAGGRS